MTASSLKQDPNTQKVQENAIYKDKTQHVNFGVITFFKLQNSGGGGGGVEGGEVKVGSVCVGWGGGGVGGGRAKRSGGGGGGAERFRWGGRGQVRSARVRRHSRRIHATAAPWS